MVDFACTYCGQALEADEAQRGQRIECTACKHRVIVPRAVVAPKGPDDSAAGRSAMGVCPNCLEPVPARAMRCSACGKRFFDPNAQPSIFTDVPSASVGLPAANTDQSAAGPPQSTTASSVSVGSNAAEEEAPDAGAAIAFVCTKCKEPLSAAASLAGQAVRCPNCGLHERVPKKRFSLRRHKH